MYQMATVMFHAAKAEDNSSQYLEERLAQLEYENKYLREVLLLSSSSTALTDNQTGDENSSNNNETSVKEEPTTLEDNVSMTSDTEEDSRSSTPKNTVDNDSPL